MLLLMQEMLKTFTRIFEEHLARTAFKKLWRELKNENADDTSDGDDEDDGDVEVGINF